MNHIEQIRRAHAGAKPNPTENPAWAHAERDMRIVLEHVDKLEQENERLRRALAFYTTPGVYRPDSIGRVVEITFVALEALKACDA